MKCVKITAHFYKVFSLVTSKINITRYKGFDVNSYMPFSFFFFGASATDKQFSLFVVTAMWFLSPSLAGGKR